MRPTGEVGWRVRPLGVCRTRLEGLEEAGSGVGGLEQVGLGSRQPSAPTLGRSRGEAVESLSVLCGGLTMAPCVCVAGGEGHHCSPGHLPARAGCGRSPAQDTWHRAVPGA